MASHIARNLDWRRKLLLAVAATAAAVGPIAIGLVNARPGRAQTNSSAAAAPAFEVASVRLDKSGVRGGQLDKDAAAGRLTVTNIPLKVCIKAAYGLQDYQLIGGPSWLEDERYDIIAKAAGPASEEQLSLMLRKLLADRFGLVLHSETKEFQGYVLIPGKNGLTLHEVQAAGKDWIRNSPGAVNGQEVSMAQLAVTLAGRLGRPVMDQTGIRGVFDIKLEWTPDPSQAKSPETNKETPAVESPSDSSGPSIFTAVQEQLGLKLDARKVPVQIYTLEHIERPSAN